MLIPAFREAFARRRCLVPADAFYEWKKIGDQKQPFAFRARDGAPLALAGLLTAIMAAPALAGTETDMFKSTDKKQTAKDFKPAPDKIHTDFGTLHFEGGAFPTEESVKLIYDELDLQRATQAFLDFYPSLSIYGIVRSQVRDFGYKTSSDFAVMADFMQPSENYLTGNDVTVYAFATLDLKVDGATVMEIPPGMYGNANDAIFKYLTDFGPTGPDKGEGGKYLFVPPGYEGELPKEGYFIVKSPTYTLWQLARAFVKDGDITVAKLLDQSGATVRGFNRLAVGEGIEKKQENFADEVMQQVKGG